jgi:hypothetical protein
MKMLVFAKRLFQFNPYPEKPVSACFGWDQIWGSFQILELRRARDQLVFNKTPHPPPTASRSRQLFLCISPAQCCLCKKYLMWGLVPVYKNAEDRWDVFYAVVGNLNHFIFKALIFWEKVKVSLAFENLWHVELSQVFKKWMLRWIEGTNYNETFIWFKKITALK